MEKNLESKINDEKIIEENILTIFENFAKESNLKINLLIYPNYKEKDKFKEFSKEVNKFLKNMSRKNKKIYTFDKKYLEVNLRLSHSEFKNFYNFLDSNYPNLSKDAYLVSENGEKLTNSLVFYSISFSKNLDYEKIMSEINKEISRKL